MLKNKKIIFICLFFIAFLLLINSNVFALTSASDSSIEDESWGYRQPCITSWNTMLDYLDTNELSFDDYHYFIVVGTDSRVNPASKCHIFLAPKNAQYTINFWRW